MDDLRLVLVVCGVVLIAAIYLWETKLRRRHRGERRDAGGVLRDNANQERRGLGFSIRPGQEDIQRPELEEASEIITAFPITEETERTPAAREPAPRRAAPRQAPVIGEPPAEKEVDDLGESVAELESLLSDLPLGDEPPADALQAANAKLEAPEPEPEPISPSGEEFVVALTVMAKDGRRLSGSELRVALEAEGLRYGDMQIFHRYGEHGGTPLFSVANAVNPGTFELDSLDSLETPGLALFARLPHTRGTARFDLMLSTAEHLARQLDADVCDDGRCTLTKQSANHIRERIIEYERRQRLG